jgi:hypothetical protein
VGQSKLPKADLSPTRKDIFESRSHTALDGKIAGFRERNSIQARSSIDRKVDTDRVGFIIVHDFAETPEGCFPGEEAAAAILDYRGSRYWIPWSSTHLVLVDFLCRHQHIPLDSWSIANKMANDPFVLQHGANAPCNLPRPARTSPTAVRQQIRRIRKVLADLIEEQSLDLDARDIICSVESSTRMVRYSINAKVTWKHWSGEEGEDSGACILFSPSQRLQRFPEPDHAC